MQKHINPNLLRPQEHTLDGGLIAGMGGDRGGQVFAYRPNLPA